MHLTTGMDADKGKKTKNKVLIKFMTRIKLNRESARGEGTPPGKETHLVGAQSTS